jgi:opacity protein-like surface antigen
MKRLIASACLAGSLVALPALAATPGYYVSGFAGGSFLPDLHFKPSTTPVQNERFDNGFAAGGAFGYADANGFRYELTSLYQHSAVKSVGGAPTNGHISSTGIMANVTYDLGSFTPLSGFTPYIGAGIGVQNVGGRIGAYSGREWQPAYQAEAGLRTELGSNMELFGEYRFTQSQSVALRSASDTARQHFSDHGVLAGLTFRLN